MSRHKNYILLVLLFFLSTNISTSQEQEVKIDTSYVEVTYFEDNLKERYDGNAFNYTINDTGGVNLIQSILRKFFGWLSDIFGFDIDFVDYKTLEVIVYSILGILVLYLFIKFLLQTPVSSVFKTHEKDIDNFKYVEENLTEINFDDLIKSALKENNFRLATRYLYLSSLKILTKRELIEWNYDKTNSDYVNEIKDDHIKKLFKRISYIYDYVWYGEFPIDAPGFEQNKKEFNQLQNAISNG